MSASHKLKKRGRTIVLSSSSSLEARDSIEEFEDLDDFIVDDSDSERRAKKRKKKTPEAEIFRLYEEEFEEQEAEVDSADYENDADARFARFQAKKAKKKSCKAAAKTPAPTSMEMAKELGIRYIGAIDPGYANAAFIVYDAYEARIVYWRVFHLRCIVEACERETGMNLVGTSKGEPVYRLETYLTAIRWWADQPQCPLSRADFVVIESQDFLRTMCAIEGAWQAALSGQKPALDVQSTYGAKEIPTRLVVPKIYSAAANSVKLFFGNYWFPSFNKGGRNAQGFQSAGAMFGKKHGVGDVSERSASQKQQYNKNKSGAAKYALMLASSSAAHSDFERAAIEGKWMSAEHVEETIERLRKNNKADDLGDVLFMALFAADCIIPSLWKRVKNPETKKKPYLVNSPEQLDKEMRDKICNPKTPDEEVVRLVAGNHQSMFYYAKERAKVSDDTIGHFLSTLNR